MEQHSSCQCRMFVDNFEQQLTLTIDTRWSWIQSAGIISIDFCLGSCWSIHWDLQFICLEIPLPSFVVSTYDDGDEFHQTWSISHEARRCPLLAVSALWMNSLGKHGEYRWWRSHGDRPDTKFVRFSESSDYQSVVSECQRTFRGNRWLQFAWIRPTGYPSLECDKTFVIGYPRFFPNTKW